MNPDPIPTDDSAAAPRRRRKAAALRADIVAAATAITNTSGWESVTMSRLAERVGVSRQTVYNEVGGKPALAQAMIHDEAQKFLAIFGDGYRRHPEDRATALRYVIERILADAEENALVQAMATSAHGASTDLLPLLTTDNDALVALAATKVAEFFGYYGIPDDRYTRDVIDALIRTVLSHILRPGDQPRTTAAALAAIYDTALRHAPADPEAESSS